MSRSTEAIVARISPPLAEHGGGARRLLLIGHNPAIQATALGLIGSAESRAAAKLAAKFPTAALAVIDFDARSWSGIRPGSGRLAVFIRPRDLGRDLDD
jgi:phosphohistidine phosphatase